MAGESTGETSVALGRARAAHVGGQLLQRHEPVAVGVHHLDGLGRGLVGEGDADLGHQLLELGRRDAAVAVLVEHREGGGEAFGVHHVVVGLPASRRAGAADRIHGRGAIMQAVLPQVSVVRWVAVVLVGGAVILAAVAGAPRVAAMLLLFALLVYVWAQPDWPTLALLGVSAVGFGLGWPSQWGTDVGAAGQQAAVWVTLGGIVGAIVRQLELSMGPRQAATNRRPAPRRRRRGRRRPGRRAHR